MNSIEKSITVDVPVRTAYNQWTQFESFPSFMEGVEEVRQQGDTHTFWRASIAGKTEEWTADITEQVPDTRVSWHSTSGAYNAGTVRFLPTGPDQTEVFLRLDYQPEGVVEKAGDALGFVERRVSGDLERFKKFIEERGSETGGWRGEIHGTQVAKPG